MTGIIHDCEQRTPEWFALRSKCILTASDFGTFMVAAKTETQKTARRKAILKSIRRDLAEFGTVPQDDWEKRIEEQDSKKLDYNLAVQRGIALESEARAHYAELMEMPVVENGFITTECGNWGCSPDGICRGSGLEIKCPLPETHLKYLLDGDLPTEYVYQVHGSIAITGIPWVFMSYCPGAPPMIVTVESNDITEQLRFGMSQMAEEKRQIMAELKGLWT